MSLLDNVIYYCNIDNPAGALMISGKWGSGKTYFVDNDLKNVLKDNYIFLKISLFGMQSIDAVCNEVKKQRLLLFTDIKNDGAIKITKIINNLIKNISPKYKKILESVPLIDLMELIPLENRINEKKAIIVFDDFERTELPVFDLLGVINELVENKHFNVILIADEEKIKDYDQYTQYKEKVIQTTLVFEPNYREVVEKICEDVKNSISDEDYKSFLNNSVNIISSFYLNQFSKKQTSKTNNDKGIDNIVFERETAMKNFRSLKCSLQGFQKVYKEISKYEFLKSEVERWLISYIIFEILYRSNIINDDETYGLLFSKSKADTLFPTDFDRNCFVDSFVPWITTCDWDQERIENDLKVADIKKQPIDGYTKILKWRITEIEDKEFRHSFPHVLEDAYNGKLDIGDYINLINNSCIARLNKIIIPDICWEKIRTGINIKVDKTDDDLDFRLRFNEREKDYFSDDEWKTYEYIIENVEKKKEKLKNIPLRYKEIFDVETFNCFEAFNSLSGLNITEFNSEMADITIEVFRKCSNSDSEDFVNKFIAIIRSNIKFFEDMISVKTNLMNMTEKLNEEINSIDTQNNPIKLFHLKNYKNEIIKLVDYVDERGK